jgi:hypothetical protein
MKCPACEKTISWKYIGQYTNWYFKRLINECPHCQLKLIFIKAPLRIFNISTLLIFSAAINYFLINIEWFSEVTGVLGLLFITYSLNLKKLKIARISR